MSDFSASYSHANQLSEIGLPNGRGAGVLSGNNTSLQTAQAVGALKNSLFYGSVSGSDSQDYYRVDVTHQTPSSFLISGLGASVGLQILDSNGNVIQGSPDNSNASAKEVRASLNPGTYYVRVFSIDNQTSNYDLSLVNGTAFYVSPYGSDNNFGNLSAPFRTVQQAVNVAQAGDSVIVRGGTYYERQIDLSHGGTADRPLTIEGTPGETAVIDNGLSVSSWSSVGGNVFVGTPNYGSGDRPENTLRVAVDNRPILSADSRSALREGTYWCDPGSGALYVWAYGGVNPGDKETLVINGRNGGSQHYGGIAIESGANHITIDGLILRASDTAIWATENAQGSGSDLTVKNSEIKFAWASAIRLDNWDGALIDNCNIHDDGQMVLPTYQEGPHAILGFNSQNVTVSHSKIHNNNGEGVGPFTGSSHWNILNNVVHDNWSVNIYVDTELGNVTVSGNYVYDSPGTTDPQNQKDGIRIASENADLYHATSKMNIDNITVTNNRIEGTGGGIRFFPYAGRASLLAKGKKAVDIMRNCPDALSHGGKAV